MNSVAGGGSLLTFPTLVALGYSPLVANVTNTVGVSPGNVGGTYAFRPQLAGQRGRLLRCGAAGAAGTLAGGLLLLATPAATLHLTITVLIAVAALLVLVQPRLTAWLQRRRRGPGHPWEAALAVGAIAVYGGYFGATIGVMLVAALGLLAPDTLQRTNALKTAITVVVNGVAAVLFAVRAPVAWEAVPPVAAGTLCGGFLGALLARRMSDRVLRWAVVAIGGAAALYVGLRG